MPQVEGTVLPGAKDIIGLLLGSFSPSHLVLCQHARQRPIDILYPDAVIGKQVSMVVHIELILLSLMPRCLYGDVYHAVVLPQSLADVFSEAIKPFIVVSSDLNLVAPILQVQGVAEAAQEIWVVGMEICGLKLHGDVCPSSVDVRLIPLDALELGKVFLD